LVDDNDTLRQSLRIQALVVIALCGVAMILAWFPGVRVYREANDCFGHALGQLFSAHGGGGHSTCESRYVLEGTKLAGSWKTMLALAPVVLGGFAMRRWPRPLIAWACTLPTLVLLVIALLLTFDVQIFSLDHEVPMWPTYVIAVIAAIIALIMTELFVAMPIVGFVRWRARKRAERERLPEAKVV